jgi:hypothetical protein
MFLWLLCADTGMEEVAKLIPDCDAVLSLLPVNLLLLYFIVDAIFCCSIQIARLSVYFSRASGKSCVET